MTKPKILLQLDNDSQPSSFDAVVAVDAGVEQLLAYGDVSPSQVRGLVHGAIFTRGPQDLQNTAIFIGGSNVAAGENLLEEVTRSFFGPMRVSVMMDANGANTTAAAAVLAAARHVDLANSEVLVLAATGPVGQRVVRLLAQQGTAVRVASRGKDRAEIVCQQIRERCQQANVTPVVTTAEEDTQQALQGTQAVIAAGAAAVQLLSQAARISAQHLEVAIDLNAVPPCGLEGVAVHDKAAERDGVICYGAIGVGGTKMKIHKEALRRLFSTNELVLDAEEIFAIGRDLE